MKSGNPSVSIAALAVLGSLWVGEAGDVHEDGTEALYSRPAVAAQAPGMAGCDAPLQFEHIHPARAGAPVEFEWEPATGVLSFQAKTAIAAINLPEPYVSAAFAQPGASCESR